MSSIRMFRLNGYDPYAGGKLKFYCKVQDGDEYVMCNFCISDDGLYHYPRGAHILTKNEYEAENIKSTYISHENLNKLFTVLKDLEWFDGEAKLEISVEGKKIFISGEVEEDNEDDGEDEDEEDDELDEDGVYDDFSDTIFYPGKKSLIAIEINTDYLREKLNEDSRSLIYRLTAEWLKNNDFNEQGTIWEYGCNSANFQGQYPIFSMFIIPIGFPDNFRKFLITKLTRLLNRNVRQDSIHPNDEWMDFCQVANNKVWEKEDPVTWRMVGT